MNGISIATAERIPGFNGHPLQPAVSGSVELTSIVVVQNPGAPDIIGFERQKCEPREVLVPPSGALGESAGARLHRRLRAPFYLGLAGGSLFGIATMLGVCVGLPHETGHQLSLDLGLIAGATLTGSLCCFGLTLARDSFA
jgi:hypothetical protein